MQQLPSSLEVSELSRTLLFTAQRLRSVEEDISNQELDIARLHNQDIDLEKQSSLVESSREIYKKVVEEVYLKSIGKIEETLNDALKFIFNDKMYSIKIEIGDSRGKTIEFFLYDNEYEPPRIVNMKDGVGDGMRIVVSFVLLSFYLIASGRTPIIFIDEDYSGVSENYVDRFFSFVSSLCKARGVVLVMITHDHRFLGYADKRYQISEGNISLKEV